MPLPVKGMSWLISSVVAAQLLRWRSVLVVVGSPVINLGLPWRSRRTG